MSRNTLYDKELLSLKDSLSNMASSALLSLEFGPEPADADYEDYDRDVEYNLIRRLCADVCDEMLKIYEAKDQDYSADGKPMGNLRTSEDVGIPAWRGVLIRMNDKKNRIGSFANRGSFEVKDESIADTLQDLANYAILGLLLFREAKENYFKTIVNFDNESLALRSYCEKIEFAYVILASSAILLSIYYQYEKRQEFIQSMWQNSQIYENLRAEFAFIANFSKTNFLF